MNQKMKRIILAVVALAVVVIGVFVYQNMNQDRGNKEISIVLKVDNKVIYDEKEKSNAGTLADLLKEMKEEKDIQLEYKNESFGMYITGMGKDKVYSEDKGKNLFWTYNSKNNASCVKAGYCDGADALKIADQDVFEFKLAKFEY